MKTTKKNQLLNIKSIGKSCVLGERVLEDKHKLYIVHCSLSWVYKYLFVCARECVCVCVLLTSTLVNNLI